MDFLIDVHLPVSLSKFLAQQPSCTSIHVNQILQKWYTSDQEICKYADENGLVVISKDTDFKNSHFINKTPKKIIRVTLGNISNIELLNIFTIHLSAILSFTDAEKFYMEIQNGRIVVI